MNSLRAIKTYDLKFRVEKGAHLPDWLHRSLPEEVLPRVGMFLTSKVGLIILTFLALISMQWLAASLLQIIRGQPENSCSLLLSLVTALGTALLIVIETRKYLHSRVRLRSDERLSRALIMFLSPPEDARGCVPFSMELTGDLCAPEFCRVFRTSPWRMPMEAVANGVRAKRLQHIFVIGSRDTQARLDDFSRLAQRLTAEAGPYLRVYSLRDLDNQELHGGIDFEDAEQLVESVTGAFRCLRAASVDQDEIVVDITGGRKPASIVGGAVASGESGRFQYCNVGESDTCRVMPFRLALSYVGE